MTNNSDGLTPTLRPQLGVGWNRALPSPFKFDLAFTPDGVDDSFNCPRMIGRKFPDDFAFEFFIRMDTTTQGGIFRIWNIGFTNLYDLRSFGQTNIEYEGNLGNNANFNGMVQNEKAHFVFNSTRLFPKASAVQLLSAKNGVNNPASQIGVAYSNARFQPIGSDGNYGEPFIVSSFSFSRISGFVNKSAFADFRIYKRTLTPNEIDLHYNNGAFNNPSDTESLWAWWKFEKFEMLDFSELQDNSDIRLGIRDYSGNGFHLEPHDMITDPTNANYVLKPF